MESNRRILEDGELIDTCWDVNLALYAVQSTNCGELIDTCWDVNRLSIINHVRI